MAEKTILITGVNGFLGSCLAACLAGRHRLAGIGTASELSAPGIEIYRKMVLPRLDLVDFVREIKPDAVVHCAGSASVPFSLEHPEADFHAGPALVLHVLDALRRANVPATFIFPSSAAVYGNPGRLPVVEESAQKPLSPYGYHKAMSEAVVLQHHELYGVPHVIMRLFSCYGAGLRKQLLWDASRKILDGALTLHGTGEETRDFIHVWDVARFIAMCIDDDVRNMTVNVASGTQISVRSIANLLLRSLGSDIEPQFSGAVRPGDPLRWEADVQRMESLGFEPRINLERGVRHYAQWFLAEHQKTRTGERISSGAPECSSWMPPAAEVQAV